MSLFLGDITRAELAKAIEEIGEKPAAAASVFLKYYKNRAGDLDALTPRLWNKIIEKYPISQAPQVEKRVSVKDGTVKFLLRFSDGAPAECVLLHGKGGRITACISSQSGCACGCKFCATGALGFLRNLQPHEIIDQYKTVLKEAGHIESIVFMGMGEPFLNWDNVKKAILILSDPKAFAFSQSKITVSTIGIVPVIEELINSDLKIKLAVSLITSSEEHRAKLAPMQSKYPLSKVLAAVKAYSLKKRMQILAEYIIFDGENDSNSDAKNLINMLHGINCRVNLIPLNINGSSSESRITKAKVFQNWLINAGLRTYLRLEKGADIAAACGQLAASLK